MNGAWEVARASRSRTRKRQRTASCRPGRHVADLFDEGGVVTAGLPVAVPEGGCGRRGARLPRPHRTSSPADQGGRGQAREARRDERHGGEERPDRGQPAPRRLDREALQRPRPDAARPDPGGQPRPHPCRREVRLAARLQVLDLRDLVDPAGHHARARGPVADDPDPRPHGRADEPRRRVRRALLQRTRPRADARGDRSASSR